MKIALCSRAIDDARPALDGGRRLRGARRGAVARTRGARRRRLRSPARCRSGRSSSSAAASPARRCRRGALVAAPLATPRIAHLLDGLAALERSPRALATVLGWTIAMGSRGSAATIAVAAALGLPHPLLAALVILPALDVAGAFPITPGRHRHRERRGRGRAREPRHRHDAGARRRVRDPGGRDARQRRAGVARQRSTCAAAIGRRAVWTLRVARVGASVGARGRRRPGRARRCSERVRDV